MTEKAETTPGAENTAPGVAFSIFQLQSTECVYFLL